jgi:hypothetical protein
MEFKIKPTEKVLLPKGYLSKVARKILDEFLFSNQEKAIVEIKGTEKEFKGLYNAMKSILRRNNKYKGKVNCSISMKEKVIYLWKEESLFPFKR